MDTKNLISIQQFCIHYKVPVTFIEALHEYDLIEITIAKDQEYISVNQINVVEKMVRLHYDLDINIEGIDVVYNLLKQVEILQKDIIKLNNKLKRYED